jgi:hypothetical protein
VPLGTFDVVTLRARLLPSFTDEAPVTEYVRVRLVSFIVTEELVATTLPLILPVLICIWKVSDPSVVSSAVVVTLKIPAFEGIVKEPL